MYPPPNTGPSLVELLAGVQPPVVDRLAAVTAALASPSPLSRRRDPVVVNDGIRPLPTMSLSIGYDHRVLDGITAAAFTSALRDGLQHL